MGGSMGILPGPAFVASANIGPFRVVKLGTTPRQVTQCTATTDTPIGVAQPGQKGTPGVSGSDTTVAAAAGDPIQDIAGGNIAKVVLGTGGCTAADKLTVDANGAAVTMPAGAGNYNVLGWALDSGAAADTVDVYVWPHKDTH
jgi:hypothetical protein